MKRLALCMLLVASATQASDPGEPLDCSDWVFLEPGYSCTYVIPPTGSDSYSLLHGIPSYSHSAVDNQGRLLFLRSRLTALCTDGASNDPFRFELVAVNGPSEIVIGYIEDRCRQPGSQSMDDFDTRTREASGFYLWKHPLEFDAVNGRVLISSVSAAWQPNNYGPLYWMAAINGFTSLYEIHTTFQPQVSALGFRVPYMPEGMAAADSFDTYWGPLTKPLDFAQAHPLACHYPAAPPSVGDYLSVADTVPTPAPGQGVYYVTAATYQGATRYGRKASGGVLSGRDPAVLPACAESP